VQRTNDDLINLVGDVVYITPLDNSFAGLYYVKFCVSDDNSVGGSAVKTTCQTSSGL